MKAYILHDINDLRYQNVETPKLQDGWALIRVKGSCICSSDIPRIYKKGTYHFPTIPGHEFSGIVEEVANEKDSALVGKHVGIFPLIPCRKCKCCKQEQYEMCESYDYVGSRRDGGFAEQVAVPVWNLVPLTDNIPLDEAAMMEPLAVALHAVKKMQIQSGESIAIIGTGMIGFAAAQWAQMQGAAKVTIVGRNMEKKALLGKNSTVDYILEADLKEGLYDKVLEAVGTPPAICTAIRATRAGGITVLMGNPSGDILLPQDVYWRILRKQISLVGTWNSAYGLTNARSDWEEVAQALEERHIEVRQLISHRFPQNKLVEGLNIMRNNSEVYCKVLVEWNV